MVKDADSDYFDEEFTEEDRLQAMIFSDEIEENFFGEVLTNRGLPGYGKSDNSSK